MLRRAVEATQASVGDRLVPIRYSKEDGMWVIPGEERKYFEYKFKEGLLRNVVFVPLAREMMCEPEHTSTGEAIGQLTLVENLVGYSGRKTEVVYNRAKKNFYTKDESEIVHYADYVALLEGGTAIAYNHHSSPA